MLQQKKHSEYDKNMAMIRAAALKILEYDTIEYAEPRRSLAEAAEIAVELNEIDSPERYDILCGRKNLNPIPISPPIPWR
jgi:hypothetical protein